MFRTGQGKPCLGHEDGGCEPSMDLEKEYYWEDSTTAESLASKCTWPVCGAAVGPMGLAQSQGWWQTCRTWGPL